MMSDEKFEPGPDGIDAAKAWLRGDIKKQGSPRDLLARRILEWMLRDQPGGALLHILADAIADGRLVMKRKRGRRQANAYAIAAFVEYQRTKAGGSVESAVKKAEHKFGRKSSTIYSARKKWRGRI